MGYPVTDVLRDAAGSLGYAAMVLEAGENSRMKAAERDLGEAEAIVVDMLAALQEAVNKGYMWDNDPELWSKANAAIARAKGIEA
jgi:hypothetical protein